MDLWIAVFCVGDHDVLDIHRIELDVLFHQVPLPPLELGLVHALRQVQLLSRYVLLLGLQQHVVEPVLEVLHELISLHGSWDPWACVALRLIHLVAINLRPLIEG